MDVPESSLSRWQPEPSRWKGPYMSESKQVPRYGGEVQGEQQGNLKVTGKYARRGGCAQPGAVSEPGGQPWRVSLSPSANPAPTGKDNFCVCVCVCDVRACVSTGVCRCCVWSWHVCVFVPAAGGSRGGTPVQPVRGAELRAGHCAAGLLAGA